MKGSEIPSFRVVEYCIFPDNRTWTGDDKNGCYALAVAPES